jgi:hypothetical protein
VHKSQSHCSSSRGEGRGGGRNLASRGKKEGAHNKSARVPVRRRRPLDAARDLPARIAAPADWR